MEKKKIKIDGIEIGANAFHFIAGPCSIESRESLAQTACALKNIGVRILRGGAYRVRTSPHSFRGLGDIAISYLKEVCAEYDLISMSECIDPGKVDFMAKNVDILLLGSRNMQNLPLLERLGGVSNPVVLKRGMSATYQEWLNAAEYIIEAGNPNVILCERGIRTFESYTNDTIDISAICAMQGLSTLPVMIDLTHSTGRREMIKPLTWAAVAAGADAVMVETHNSSETGMCESGQSISIDMLEEIKYPVSRMRELLFQENQFEIFR